MKIDGTSGVTGGGNNDLSEAQKFAAECRANPNAAEQLAKNDPQRAAKLLQNADLLRIAHGFWSKLKHAVEEQNT